MYTGRLIFYRRELVVATGGFRSGFGTALHYDLALRATERSKCIEHRPRIFYHERAEGAAAIDQEDAAGAIASALERRERKAASSTRTPGSTQISSDIRS